MSAPRPPHEPDPSVLMIRGVINRADISVLCERFRGLLEDSDACPVVCDVGELAHPDAVVVEALAKLQLTAKRAGRQIWLLDAFGKLEELLALMGLQAVVPEWERLTLGLSAESKKREESLRVEEKRDPGDPTA